MRRAGIGWGMAAAVFLHALPTLVGARVLSDTPAWATEGDQVGAQLGISVSTAGDVNRDGYSDVIVGVPHFFNNFNDEGGAFVCFGGPGGLSLVADWFDYGNQADAQFGSSVATAGDINWDAYSDIVIGAPGYTNGETSEGAIFVYYGGPSGPGTTPDWTDEGDVIGYGLGAAVATAGDFNMDQRTEILAVAIGTGDALFYLNSGSSLPAAPTRVLTPTSGAYASVSTAGDTNGDGMCDFVLGNPTHSDTLVGQGYVALYLGSGPPAPQIEVLGEQTGERFGASVGMAGDVNGDGYCDVIVGAPGYENDDPGEGAAMVFHGNTVWTHGSPDWINEGDQTDAEFGTSVSTAGDANGDGYADVIVGSPTKSSGEAEEGMAFLYLGSASGLDIGSAWSTQADQPGANLGSSVFVAGDVNGDGFSDVIVGAPGYVNGEDGEGGAFVYHGSGEALFTEGWAAVGDAPSAYLGSSLAGVGDVNGDGYHDFVVGSPGWGNGESIEGKMGLFLGSETGPAPAPDWEYEPDVGSASLGMWVAGAGDVNGDGFSDFLAGAYHWVGISESRVLLFHGTAAVLPSTPDWVSQTTGQEVASAGDVNGDGYADVLVGDPDYEYGQQNEGRVLLYLGSAGGLTSHPNWSFESNSVDALLGTAVASAGDVDGDGYSDILVGAPNDDTVYLFYGHPQGLAALPDVIMWAPGTGTAVSTAGDVDRDGYSDILVGAEWSGSGEVHVYHGSAGGISGGPDQVLVSLPNSGNFGNAVATAGDLNGDGYSDVIVGDYHYDNGAQSEGAVHLFMGSASGLGDFPIWAVESNDPQAEMGHAVAVAGDVNADGYPDVLVGAHLMDDVQFYEGRVSLYYGNYSPGRPMMPRQARPGNTPVQLLGHTYNVQRARVGMLKNSTVGWTFTRTLMDVERLGIPLTADNPFSGGITMAVFPPSLEQYTLTFLSAPQGQPFHWRVRFAYYPYMNYTRWVSPGPNALSETDFRLAVDCVPVGPDIGCDGTDDDCDGPADEDWVPIVNCGFGYCATNATPSSCIQGVETPCQPGSPLSLDDSTCDGVDDNCNAFFDEDADAAGACDDGLFCNGAEYCDEGNTCLAGTPPSCDDGVICTVDSCSDILGACENIPDDTLCDDAQWCNGFEACIAAGCQLGTPVDCDDTVVCTRDQCNEATDSCDNTADDTSCNDGNPCTANVCDPLLDCQYPDQDGIACTILTCNGTCLGGLCDGCSCLNAADCDDGVSCTSDDCQAGMCINLPQNEVCNDLLYCNGVESCNPQDDCQPGSPVDCSDPVSCTEDACDEATDSCVNGVNHNLCDNGSYCDGEETCDQVLGCTPGVQVVCDDNISCTADLCDDVLDACENPVQSGYCHIQGSCVPEDSSRPGDPCAVCLPAISLTEWSLRPEGTPCGEASCATGLYTPAPLCDADGACQDQSPYPCDSGDCLNPQECLQTGDGVLVVSPGPGLEPGTRVRGRDATAVLHLELDASGTAGRLTRMRLDFPGLAGIPVFWHEVEVRLLAGQEMIGEALLHEGQASFEGMSFGYQNNSRHQLTIQLYTVRRALGASATYAWVLLAGLMMTAAIRRRRGFLMVLLVFLLLAPVACQVGYQRMVFDGRVTLDPETDVGASTQGQGTITVQGDSIEGDSFVLDLSY